MRVSESAERALKEAETASMAAGRASEAAGRALGGKGGRNDNENEGNKVYGKKISQFVKWGYHRSSSCTGLQQ